MPVKPANLFTNGISRGNKVRLEWFLFVFNSGLQEMVFGCLYAPIEVVN